MQPERPAIILSPSEIKELLDYCVQFSFVDEPRVKRVIFLTRSLVAEVRWRRAREAEYERTIADLIRKKGGS